MFLAAILSAITLLGFFRFNITIETKPTTVLKQDKSRPIESNDDPDRSIAVTEDVLSIVVELSGGEVGNQMNRIANGLCVQSQIEEHLHLKTKLMFLVPGKKRLQKAMEDTKKMFPNTVPYFLDENKTSEFNSVHKVQVEWINQLLSKNHLDMTNIQNPTILSVRICSAPDCYSDLVNLVNQTRHMKRPTNPSSGDFSLPHVLVDKFASTHCKDMMYDEIRAFF